MKEILNWIQKQWSFRQLKTENNHFFASRERENFTEHVHLQYVILICDSRNVMLQFLLQLLAVTSAMCNIQQHLLKEQHKEYYIKKNNLYVCLKR